ncbi:hypothetical protein [Naasia sp. SYSU D00948]|uniref:hypothetical protein n=1 Tax=Naasia sp. SYSU D00948 TaxID=2817379 RepID=UPI001B305C8E|nr:hypothetical protein [Naasia sp. SYSU D00948]
MAVLGIIAAAIMAVGSAVRLLEFALSAPPDSFLDELGRFLSPDGESNLWSWFSTLLLAALAFAFCAVGSLHRRSGGAAAPYYAFSAVAVYMSIDESASLHERFEDFIPQRLFMFQWLILGVPFALLVGAAVLWLSRRLREPLRRRLLVAGLVFLAGAVGVELVQAVVLSITGWPQSGAGRILYAGAVIVEEALEVCGVLIALWAVLREAELLVQNRQLTLQLAPSGSAQRTGPDRGGEGRHRIDRA